MAITFLHTSRTHEDPFQALVKRIAPEVPVFQAVHEDWLSRARKDGLTEELGKEIAHAVHDARGTVVCTCTTIGPAAEAAGALVIDRPMMQEAARIGGRILLVHALDSTLQPSRMALEAALNRAGNTGTIMPLSLARFWPLFEAEEKQAFVACIAAAVRDALPAMHPDCIVLAQASMADAKALLSDLGTPVLSSPELAIRAALKTGSSGTLFPGPVQDDN